MPKWGFKEDQVYRRRSLTFFKLNFFKVTLKKKNLQFQGHLQISKVIQGHFGVSPSVDFVPKWGFIVHIAAAETLEYIPLAAFQCFEIKSEIGHTF